jgi:hypothetical protein
MTLAVAGQYASVSHLRKPYLPWHDDWTVNINSKKYYCYGEHDHQLLNSTQGGTCFPCRMAICSQTNLFNELLNSFNSWFTWYRSVSFMTSSAMFGSVKRADWEQNWQSYDLDNWHVPVSRLPTCTFNRIQNYVPYIYIISTLLSLSDFEGAIGGNCGGVSKPLQLSRVGLLTWMWSWCELIAQIKFGVEALTLFRFRELWVDFMVVLWLFRGF